MCHNNIINVLLIVLGLPLCKASFYSEMLSTGSQYVAVLSKLFNICQIYSLLPKLHKALEIGAEWRDEGFKTISAVS